MTVSLKPKIFKKLNKPRKTIQCGQVRSLLQMGEKIDSGFGLKEPNVQGFEKKLKESKEATATVASAAS